VWQLFISICLTFFSAPFGSYSRSVFLRALQDAFGYTPLQISFFTVLSTEEAAIEGPIVGWLLDKIGPRWTNTIGWFFYGVGYMLLPALAFFGGNLFWLYALLSIQAIGNATQYPAMYKAANTWFIKNRGMAIGATVLGAGFGTPLVVPV